MYFAGSLVLYGSGLELIKGDTHDHKIVQVEVREKSILLGAPGLRQWEPQREAPASSFVQLPVLPNTKCVIAVSSEVVTFTGLSTNPLSVLPLLWPGMHDLDFPACSYLPTHCNVNDLLWFLTSPLPVFPFPTPPPFFYVLIPIVNFLFI